MNQIKTIMIVILFTLTSNSIAAKGEKDYVNLSLKLKNNMDIVKTEKKDIVLSLSKNIKQTRWKQLKKQK